MSNAQASVVTDPNGTGHAGRESFAAVYVRRLAEIRRLVAGMGFAAADADDILQDVYVEASQRPGVFRSAGEAANWLFRVAVNRCLLEHRRRERFSRAAREVVRRREAADDRKPGGEEKLVRAEELESVRRTLREMDESLAAVLVLRYFCELDSTRIGQILDVASATARSRLRKARLQLAERLTNAGDVS